MGHLDTNFSGTMATGTLDGHDLVAHDHTDNELFQVKKRRMTLPTVDTTGVVQLENTTSTSGSETLGYSDAANTRASLGLASWMEHSSSHFTDNGTGAVSSTAGFGGWSTSTADPSSLLLNSFSNAMGYEHITTAPSDLMLSPGKAGDDVMATGSTIDSVGQHPLSVSSTSTQSSTTVGSFDTNVDGLAFSPGSETSRPLPPRVGRVMSHRSPMRGSRLSSKKPRSLSLAFDKVLAADSAASVDSNTHSPGPITPAMFSPSFLESMQTSTGPESPIFFSFSSTSVEPSQLIHNPELTGFTMASDASSLHSPAHINASFATAIDPASLALMSGNNGSTQSLASTTASGNGHPATTVAMAMGANGTTMSFAGLNSGNIPSTFRNRMGSLTSFSAHPSSPLTPHTPVPEGIMASNIIPQMPVWNNSPNPAHMQSLMAMNKDFGFAAAGSSTAIHFGPTPLRGGGYSADQFDKCIVILTPKVAQKSYGSEKRFLCPPPTVLLLGSGWCIPPPYHLPGTGANVQSLLNSTGPRLMVGIPNESAPQQPTIEWVGGGLGPKMDPSGSGGEPNNPGDPDHSITGRCVSKNLYINEADEKRKKVEVYVKLHSSQGELLSTFHSKPIKVISKPSKKRQSLKNIELCIHHGSTVSLFNRLRSQTVSTKYLSVSNSMASGGPRPNWSNVTNASLDPESTCFVARTNLWDPFIIWIVDPNQPLGDIMNYPNSPPIPGYPPPPTIAIHPRCPPDFAMVDSGLSGSGVDGGGSSGAGGTAHGGPAAPTPTPPIPIHYNQTVVLQCLSTGMVSPVMIIRKVEKGSMVVGGILSSETGKEVLGDPVSQLHKVAFEISQGSPMTAHAYPNGDVGSYLACLTDVVGTQPSKGGKKPFSHLATPPNSTDGEVSPTTPKHRVSGGNPHPGAMIAGNGPVDGTGFHYGGSVLGHDDTSGPLLMMGGSGHISATGKTVHKGQKRNSMSRHSGGHDSACAAAWVEDAQDCAIWTIVGSESSQYTIKGGNLSASSLTSVIPTGYDMGLMAGNGQHPVAARGMMAPPPAHHDPHGVNNFTTMGADHHRHLHQHHSALLSPIKVEGGGQDGSALGESMHQSPFSPAFNHHHHHSLGGLVGNGHPTVTQVIVGEHDQGTSGTSAPGTERSDSAGDGQGNGGQSPSAQATRKVVTIFGENFQPKMKVWFGQYSSPHVEWRSSQVMVCLAPMVGDAHGPTADMRGMILPISLGLPEHDDMVVPTNQTFTL